VGLLPDELGINFTSGYARTAGPPRRRWRIELSNI
jgi:hypothetical protein